MTCDKTPDVLTILDQAVVHIAPDATAPTGRRTSPPATAAFARRDKYLRFERAVRMQRSGQIIEADTAVAHLSADEKRIETVELREQRAHHVAEGEPRRRCRR